MATIAQAGSPGRTTGRTHSKILFAAVALAWVVAFIAGSLGVVNRLESGHRAADYGSQITWGLWVAAYQYLIEMAAGAFLLAAAIYLLRLKPVDRLAPVALLLGITSLLAGMAMVWLDLGRMERFWRVILTPNWDSIIAWVVVAYTAFLIISTVALWFALRGTFADWSGSPSLRGAVARILLFGQAKVSAAARERDLKVVRALMVIGLVPAIGFSGGEGALFGVIGARPYWNSPTLPISFLASAVVTAGATITVLGAFVIRGLDDQRAEIVQFFGRITLVALAALLVLEFAEFSLALYSSVPAQEMAYEEILTGDYWWSFWVIHLLLGAVVPFGILMVRGRSIPLLGVAALLAGAGMFTVRLNAVIPGQVVPHFDGLSEAFVNERLQFDYFPSAMEWLVTLFVGCLALLLFYIGYQLLPVWGEDSRTRASAGDAHAAGGGD